MMFGSRPVNGIYATPGYSDDLAEYDWMHSGDLGVNISTLGNIIRELVYELGGVFDRAEEALGNFLTMMHMPSKALGQGKPPLNDLTQGMVKSARSKPPMMRVKAAEARHLVPVLRHMMMHYVPQESPHELLLLHCLDALHSCYGEMESWNEHSAEALGKHGRHSVSLYKELNVRALADDPTGRNWRLYPKVHAFFHICESGCNARTTWNYWDESDIGDAAILGATCHPIDLSAGVIQRYRLHDRA
ncbi:hypothetical protein N9L68_06960 [bacterium]|nr:hypothetical protein [bacterium]